MAGVATPLAREDHVVKYLRASPYCSYGESAPDGICHLDRRGSSEFGSLPRYALCPSMRAGQLVLPLPLFADPVRVGADPDSGGNKAGAG